MSDGAHVEIVEPGHDSGLPLMPTTVRVNGTDVGTLAEAPKVDTGDSDHPVTVTLVLVPRRIDLKGEPKGARPSKARLPIGFRPDSPSPDPSGR
ncbi:hypothetical protein [Kitasatospora sp. MBT66]|uniref:hypothetical protein n=1 Tax=Kitasatospora sp. MBT66 TaxID=1444769 RepID=UPI000691B2BB|nr:hypothetical protein [Kitasatospora sp. MBT66]